MADEWKKVEMAGSWDPEEDKEIVGVLVNKEENVGPNESMMYTIETETGERLGVWGSTVLNSRMGQVPVGTEVKIVYKGKATSDKTGRQYKDYEVYIRDAPLVKEMEEALED